MVGQLMPVTAENPADMWEYAKVYQFKSVNENMSICNTESRGIYRFTKQNKISRFANTAVWLF